jgi:hypothetical protein
MRLAPTIVGMTQMGAQTLQIPLTRLDDADPELP